MIRRPAAGGSRLREAAHHAYQITDAACGADVEGLPRDAFTETTATLRATGFYRVAAARTPQDLPPAV